MFFFGQTICQCQTTAAAWFFGPPSLPSRCHSSPLPRFYNTLRHFHTFRRCNIISRLVLLYKTFKPSQPSQTSELSTVTMSSPSFLQLQTQAGHGSSPINIGRSAKSKNRSDESVNTLSSSSSSSSRKGSLDIVRCSRCQRTLSIDSIGPACQNGAIRFGLNSYVSGSPAWL